MSRVNLIARINVGNVSANLQLYVLYVILSVMITLDGQKHLVMVRKPNVLA